MDNSRIVNEKKEAIQRIKAKNSSHRKYTFERKMIINKIKYQNKEKHDLDFLKQTILELEPGYTTYIISDKFDSPNLTLAINEITPIAELYISTWAITDKGLSTIKELNDNGVDINLLLDKTYSYKWVFSSGAIDYLKNVNFRFTENHSKIQLIKTANQYLTISGSMNYSNNPRLENIAISTDKDLYIFYKSFFDTNYFNEKSNKQQAIQFS